MNQQAAEAMRLGLVSWVSRYRSLLHIVTIVPFLILFTYLSLSEPKLNWDMLAYVANALQATSDAPIAEIHQWIYASLQSSIPAEDLAYYTNSASRRILSSDPEAFSQTVKFFYDSRVVYIATLAVLVDLGMNPFFASYFISTICSVLSILLLSRLIPVQMPLGLYFALPFITLAFGLLSVARLSSPDAMATLFIIGLYWLLIRSYLIPVLLMLPLSVFVRTDLIILMPMFLGYLFLLRRISRPLIILSGIATVVAYLVLNNYIVDGDPWSSLIGYNYGSKPTHPADYTFTVTFAQYLSYIFLGLKSFSYNPLFFVFCALSVTGVFMFSSFFFFNPKKRELSHQHTALLFLIVSCVAYVALHFLLFPVTWIRFFAAQYTLVAVVVLWTTLAILAERNYSDRTEVRLLGG